MKRLIVCLFTLCLLAAVPASAGVVLYTNGALNGTIDGWNITSFEVTDSFVISSGTTMTSFDFASWNYPDYLISTVDWAVGTTAFGTDVASGTASVSSVYDGGYESYNIYTDTVSGLSVGLSADTYYLTLTNADDASVDGQPFYWDENDGPSTASQTSTGEIGSEAFTIYGDTSVPEPGSMALLGGGILVMLGALRRRKIG